MVPEGFFPREFDVEDFDLTQSDEARLRALQVEMEKVMAMPLTPERITDLLYELFEKPDRDTV